MSDSPDTPTLLLIRDPRAFMAVVQNPNDAERVEALHTLDDLMACEVLRHGIFNDQSTLPGLVGFYDRVFARAPADRRKEIYGYVAVIVTQLGGWTASAFTPFMLLDTDTGLVSTATIDYASLGSLLDDDPMTRPRDVIDMIVKGLPRNPGAVLAGLLVLGDPRVCELIRPLRPSLSPEQVGVVTRCFSGLVSKCMVEFYLDWLDELIDRDDVEGLEAFGNVVSGLCRLAEARTRFVLDGLRPFPVPTGAGDWPNARVIGRDEFSASIAARLYDLESRERAPKVVPHIIRAFGLMPRTAAKDVALMQ